jgi:hypothetical protein
MRKPLRFEEVAIGAGIALIKLRTARKVPFGEPGPWRIRFLRFM